MKASPDIYSAVSQKIISALESGTVPWVRPWQAQGGFPKNLVSGKHYQGVNLLLLALTPYTSPNWATFNQIRSLGGSVKKGEKATMVVYWKILDVEDRKNSEKSKKIPLLRYYQVFNIQEQTTGLENKLPKQAAPLNFNPIEEAEKIISGYQGAPAIEYGSDRALYFHEIDTVRMPSKESFKSIDGWYNTLFHELTHSTGHQTRLNREELVKYGETNNRSSEELTAEIGASMLSSMAGIDSTFQNTVAYIKSWIKPLKDDPKMVVLAVGRATKACEWVLGNRKEEITEIPLSIAA